MRPGVAHGAVLRPRLDCIAPILSIGVEGDDLDLTGLTTAFASGARRHGVVDRRRARPTERNASSRRGPRPLHPCHLPVLAPLTLGE